MDNAKTYYVLSHISNRDPRWYLQPDDIGTNDIASAQQYGSLADAVLAAGGHKFLFSFNGTDRFKTGTRHKWGIVKVTETPGKTERVIVSETIIEATKPCVLSVRGQRSFVRSSHALTDDLNAARVFNDLNDALTFVYGPFTLGGDTIKVFNVVNRVGEPTITTEVMN